MPWMTEGETQTPRRRASNPGRRRGWVRGMPPGQAKKGLRRGRSHDIELGSIFTSILQSVGLKSSLSRYESRGMTLAQIFAKFAGDLDRYVARIRRIPSGTAQKPLLSKAGTAGRQREELRPAFAAGASVGKRDRERLEAFVTGMLSLRGDLRAAERKFGLRSPSEAEEEMLDFELEDETQKSGGGFPWWLLGLAAFALK